MKTVKGSDKQGSLRNTIFPIYGRQEVLKFLSVASIKFFIGEEKGLREERARVSVVIFL